MKRHALCFAALALASLVAACAPATPTRFYTLSGLPTPPRDTGGLAAGRFVGVGPIALPAYLDRPQIVTRTAANQAHLAESDNWVEPLATMVPRVLVDNLALLLGTDDVVVLPQQRDIRFAYQVQIDVNRFDVDSSGRAILDARWYVLADDTGNVTASGRSTITEPASDPGDYAEVAAAMSRALGAMSQEIATAILAKPRK
jgi:uncharacterized protein